MIYRAPIHKNAPPDKQFLLKENKTVAVWSKVKNKSLDISGPFIDH